MNYAIHTTYNRGIEQYFFDHPDDREKEWSLVLYWGCFGFRLLSALGTPGVETWEQEWKQYFPWNIVMKMNERSARRRKQEECPSFSVAVKSAAKKRVFFCEILVNRAKEICNRVNIMQFGITAYCHLGEAKKSQNDVLASIYFGPRTEGEVWPE